MSRIRLAIFCAICINTASGFEGPKLAQMKDMCLETPFVENGKPVCMIVAPAKEGYAALASELQAALAKSFNVRIPIRRDDQVTDEDLKRFHVILLGNLMTNRLSARLYCAHMLQVDAAWPGKGGYLLQTVHNPLGFGRNFISVGGSDIDGVRRAQARLLARIASRKKPSVGPIFELKTAQKIPAPIDDKQIDRIVSRLRTKGFRYIGRATVKYGTIVQRTRTPGYAKLFRKLVELLWHEMDKLKVCDDLRTTKWLPLVWDNIEESPEFTHEDRVFISNFMYAYAHKVKYAHTNTRSGPQPHGNNWNAEGSYLAGLYFAKYYPSLEIGRRLMERMDRYYNGDMKHWKVAEDCPGYGNITLNANLLYALTRPRMDYFESGNVRKAADYAVLITTNIGTVSGFGDANGLRSNYAVDVLPIAAWYYRDGSYLWWFQKIGGRPGRFWTDDLPRTPPVRLLGVALAPPDDWIYTRKSRRSVPRDRCFDKMSFRAGFERDNQYMLLSGFSYGFHSHPDGNAIINFTDNGYTWLFDDGYMVPEMAEHNTVIVYRNGLGGALPELVSLDYRADFDSVGLTRTSVSNYNGANWQRNIIWAKERYFLVLDNIQAAEDGEFAFQCVWHARGTKGLDGRTFVATDKGSEFRLTNLDGAPQGLKACHPKHPFGRRLVQTVAKEMKKGDAYTFANLFYVRGPNEEIEVEARALGRDIVVVNDTGHVSIAGIGPLPRTDTDAAVFIADAQTLTATGLTRWASPSFKFRADHPVSIAIDLARGEGVIDAAKSGQATVLGKTVTFGVGRTRIRFPAMKAAEIANRAKQFRRLFESAGAAKGEAAREEWAEVPFKRLWTFDGFEALVNRSEADAARVMSNVTPLRPDEVNFPVGSLEKIKHRNGNVMFPTGKTVILPFDLGAKWDVRRVAIYSRQLRTFQGGCGVSRFEVEVSNDRFVSDVRRLGVIAERTMPPQNKRIEYVVEGPPQTGRYVRLRLTPLTPKHKVYIDSVDVMGLASAEERKSIAFALPSVVAADLTGDGRDEVVAAASDNCVYAISSNGALLWKTRLRSRIYQVAAADLDGDGRAETIAGCADKRIYCLVPDGKVRWQTDPPPRTYARPGYRGVLPFQGPIKIVLIADLDRDGRPEILLGSGNWRTYCYSSDGKLLWDECNWAHQPTCAAAYDLNGDGVLEAIMGNDYRSAVIYHGKTGKILRTIPMSPHAGPTAIAADDLNGDGKGDLVVGDRAGRISFVVPWKGRAKSIEVGAPITCVRIVNIDDNKRILVGSANGYVYAFGPDGQPLWRRNLGDVPRGILLVDVTGDGRPEVVIGCEDSRLWVLDRAGRIVGTFPTDGPIRHVRLAEIDGNRASHEIIVASDGGYLYALKTPTP